jgi:hypothetical protein
MNWKMMYSLVGHMIWLKYFLPISVGLPQISFIILMGPHFPLSENNISVSIKSLLIYLSKSMKSLRFVSHFQVNKLADLWILAEVMKLLCQAQTSLLITAITVRIFAFSHSNPLVV